MGKGSSKTWLWRDREAGVFLIDGEYCDQF